MEKTTEFLVNKTTHCITVETSFWNSNRKIYVDHQLVVQQKCRSISPNDSQYYTIRIDSEPVIVELKTMDFRCPYNIYVHDVSVLDGKKIPQTKEQAEAVLAKGLWSFFRSHYKQYLKSVLVEAGASFFLPIIIGLFWYRKFDPVSLPIAFACLGIMYPLGLFLFVLNDWLELKSTIKKWTQYSA